MNRPGVSLGRSLPVPHKRGKSSQQRLLSQLLHTVWKHSAFYREYYASHGIREAHLAELSISDLPCVTKPLLMEHFDAAVTDRRLHKRALEQWIQHNRDPYSNFSQDFIVIHGSGTSGDIGIFVYDRTAWLIADATLASHLPPPAPTTAGKTRVAVHLASHGHFAMVSIAARMPRAAYDTLILSILDAPELVIQRLQAFQPQRLQGYASGIAALARLALQGALHIQPHEIFVGGDKLTESMAHCIGEAWNVPIYNAYGASESKYIGMQMAADAEMRVLTDLNIVEVLDGNNRPVASGAEGRVVLTNLYNHTLPIVRYELGDSLVTGAVSDAGTVSTIRAIKGRANESLPVRLADGRSDSISPHVLGEFYVAGLERLQYVSQSVDFVRLDYVGRQPLDAVIRTEFQRILDLKGASRTQFEVRRVSSIAPDPHTGKLRLVTFVTAPSGAPVHLTVHARQAAAPMARSGESQQAFSAFDKADIAQSISQRFEQQVEKYPHRLAVQGPEQMLTYDALNRQSNRVAHAILAYQGTGNAPVALVLEQGIPALIAILGALKAGKFYVPLDPTYPHARLAAISAAAQAPLIVTNTSNFTVARQLARATPVLNIDALDACFSEQNPDLAIPPDAFAYLLYTSGSTGQPKGVVQTHHHVLHQIMTYTNGLQLGRDDRLTLLHSHAFSASRLDIFGALLNGAALCPYALTRRGIGHLADWLMTQEITLFHWIPTAFRHFIDTLNGRQRLPRLRWLVLGSEPLLSRDVELYKRYFAPGCTLVNRFGSTETGTICWYFINQHTPVSHGVVPVGYAIEDIDVLLLDETGQEGASHAPGEIAVKSRYLSPGHWQQSHRRPAASAVKPTVTDGPVYRTGDMGYMLPDGCLVHLGRKDLQVKIRGHRVEVEEVERALLEHSAITDAAVVAQGTSSEEKRLVAFCVMALEPPPTSTALRSFVETRLPVYMVPAAFVRVASLPLTPSGKVDRQALSSTLQVSTVAEAPRATPRTPLEKTLVDIWSKALGVSQVGIHDNFLDLGGHSLLASTIIARVAHILGVEITFQDFFEAPTVAHLAAVISCHQGENAAGAALTDMLTSLERLTEDEARQLLDSAAREI